MNEFRWAFIGAGHIAFKTAREIVSSKRHKIVSVCSQGFTSAVKFGEEFGAKPYKTISECINHDADCVYIATPHHVHYEQIKECIENGKNVLCEKCITLNATELEELIELAKQKNVFFCEAMWTRFNPITVEVLKRIKRGDIGKIKFFRSEFSYYAYFPFVKDRVTNINKGGGALLDLGVYNLSYAQMLLGFTDNINATLKFKKSSDCFDKIELVYPDAKARLISSFTRFSLCNAIIKGEKGKIVFPFTFYKPQRCIIYSEGKREKLKCKRGYIYQFDKVAEEIRKGLKQSEFIPLKDTLEVMKMLDICRKQNSFVYPQEKEN